jgi:hypothetical protein
MRHRWQCAGGSAALPFSAEAIWLIAGASHGIPRLVNVICDNALLLAHASGDSWVTVDQIRHVLSDLDLNVSREEQHHVRPNGGPTRHIVDTVMLSPPRLNSRLFGSSISSPPLSYALGEKTELRHRSVRESRPTCRALNTAIAL